MHGNTARDSFSCTRHIFFIFGSLKDSMKESTISLTVSVVALIVSFVALLRSPKAVVKNEPKGENFNTVPLQLQAYERLVLLIERISLPNLISRMSQPNTPARELQAQLIETIKQEFEYNATQQIYVSNLAWEAVRNLRDQNMLIINQVAGLLPAEATANDLAKKVLEVIMQQQDAALHTIVQNAVTFEAKKLMQ
jgi:hypothetical protein